MTATVAWSVSLYKSILSGEKNRRLLFLLSLCYDMMVIAHYLWQIKRGTYVKSNRFIL